MPEDVGGKHVIIVRGIEFQSAYIPVIRAVDGEPPAQSVALLNTASTDASWLRVDERTLLMRQDGGMLLAPADHLCRDATPFSLGQKVTLPAVEIEVLALTSDGRPTEVRFTFNEALEHADLVFLWLDEPGRFGIWDLPAVGDEVVTKAFNPLAAPSAEL
jgi:hypothetical protein